MDLWGGHQVEKTTLVAVGLGPDLRLKNCQLSPPNRWIVSGAPECRALGRNIYFTPCDERRLQVVLSVSNRPFSGRWEGLKANPVY